MLEIEIKDLDFDTWSLVMWSSEMITYSPAFKCYFQIFFVAVYFSNIFKLKPRVGLIDSSV